MQRYRRTLVPPQPTWRAPIGRASSRPGERVTLPYLAGLDGLRAIALIAVLLYHADLPWIPGGFLGVEVFFVLSGYLISALLLTEWRSTGRIAWTSFWIRRARRLLPALFVLLAVVLAYAAIALPAELAQLRADAWTAVLYVTNWYLILHQQSYFEAVARPSLLQHLWSLAVEEQFYLLWPVALGLALSRWRPGRVLAGTLAAAAASALLMVLLYHPDVDPSRVYYGTDTRAAGLLLGAALAFVWIPKHQTRRRGSHGLVLDACGTGALLILGWCFVHLNAYEPALYRGGFALVALATAALIAVVVHPRAWLGPYVLGRPAMRWIGQRSYSIYLWHWPVFMVTRPQLDLPIGGVPLVVLRLLLTVALAEASFRLVEWPIRNGGFRRTHAGNLRRMLTAFREALHGAPPAERRLVGAVWALDAGVAAMLCVAIVQAVASAERPAAPAYLAVGAIDTTARGVPAGTSPAAGTSAAAGTSPAVGTSAAATDEPSPPPAPAASPPAPTFPPLDLAAAPIATAEPPSPVPPAPEPPTPAPSAGGTQLVAQDAAPAEPPPASQAPPPPVELPRVGAVGDSVMLSAAAAMQSALPNVEINAEVSRQVDVALGVAQSWQAAGQLGDVVVVHVGNNGVFAAEQFDALMQALAGVPRVYFLTVKVPRPWEAPNNAVIAEGVARYPQARLIDWRAASIDHPEYFWDDGIHLRPEGAAVYAELVRARILGGE